MRGSFLIIFMIISSAAFSQGYESYMSKIRENSPNISALGKRLEADKVGNRVGIAPDDPEADIAYFPRRDVTFELDITQSISFPTVYTNRSKIAKLNNERSGAEYLQNMYAVLGQARSLYFDAVYYNRKLSLVERNRLNTEKLREIYESRVKSGDATMLEKNKIDALWLDVNSQYRSATTGLENTVNKINTLSGGAVTNVTDTIYPIFVFGSETEFVNNALDNDFSIKINAIDTLIAERTVKLSRAEWLPGIKAGYRMDMESGVASNGVVAGITIPLWQNRNKLKSSKLSLVASRAENVNTYNMVEEEVKSAYKNYQSLMKSLDEYYAFQSKTNSLDIINRALKSGQISMLEYFVEFNIWYDIEDRIVELEHEVSLIAGSMRKYYE